MGDSNYMPFRIVNWLYVRRSVSFPMVKMWAPGSLIMPQFTRGFTNYSTRSHTTFRTTLLINHIICMEGRDTSVVMQSCHHTKHETFCVLLFVGLMSSLHLMIECP